MLVYIETKAQTLLHLPSKYTLRSISGKNLKICCFLVNNGLMTVVREVLREVLGTF